MSGSCSGWCVLLPWQHCGLWVNVSGSTAPRCCVDSLCCLPVQPPFAFHRTCLQSDSTCALLAAAEVSAAALLSDIAYSIADVAAATGPSGGCPRATALAVAFYNGLLIAAPDAAPAFAANVGAQVRAIQSSCVCPLTHMITAADQRTVVIAPADAVHLQSGQDLPVSAASTGHRPGTPACTR